MRSMSMLQLLGGVAVAGAVAAGATAFTAGGVSASGLSATNDGFLGGQVTPAVHGAALTALTFTQAADVSGVNKISAVNLTFDSNTPQNSTVSMTSDGAVTSSGSATGFYCSAVDSNHQSVCTPGDNSNHTNGDTWSALTTLTLTVS
jgi:hypothetical protein